MNIAYFRNSEYSAKETLEKLIMIAAEKGFSILGEVSLPDGMSTVVTICKPDWAQQVVDIDPNLLGLLPCTVSVVEKDGIVMVGAGTPTLLGQVVHTEEMMKMIEAAEASLHELVETAAGVGPLSPKELILYSSHTCPYCLMEKNWLDERGVAYKLVYVDEDQDAAISLVQRSGQRGVPITEVIYDNDETEFVVGFDRGKLETVVAAL